MCVEPNSDTANIGCPSKFWTDELLPRNVPESCTQRDSHNSSRLVWASRFRVLDSRAHKKKSDKSARHNRPFVPRNWNLQLWPSPSFSWNVGNPRAPTTYFHESNPPPLNTMQFIKGGWLTMPIVCVHSMLSITSSFQPLEVCEFTTENTLGR